MPINAENINANADKQNSKINDKTAKISGKFNKFKSGTVAKKKKIFGKIAAAKAFVDGLTKQKNTSSMSSINNDGNSLSFLSDMIKSLIGYSALIEVVVSFLYKNMDEIEELIKNSLKEELKSIVSCGVNPTIPSFLNNPGVVLEVSKIDFLGIFKISPNDEAGKLIYNDITNPLTNSSDFNTFLYGVIQDDGVQYTWDNMLDITFNSLGNATRPNNTITIKANPSFSSKKLIELNNSFINKGPIIDTNKVVNNAIDTIYGTISSTAKKSLKQLQMEAKLNDIIDRLIDSNNKESIDDSYFTFTNDDVYRQQEQALLRKKGITKLDCCQKVAVSMPISFLTDFNNEMNDAGILNKKEVIINNINKMAEQNTVNSENPSDNISLKLDFIQQMINSLIKSSASAVISPKIVTITSINQKIVYGQASDYANSVDYIKLCRNLIKLIIKKITEREVKELMKVVLVYVGQLTAKIAAKKLIEKANNRKSQIASLAGVPQDGLRALKGLT